MISEGDKKFLDKGMAYFGIKAIKIGWSESKKRYPDLWCEMTRPPKITVTAEWARQPMHERRKRLTHELAHIGWGLEHGKHRGLVYSTYPERDTYSKALYREILRVMG